MSIRATTAIILLACTACAGAAKRAEIITDPPGAEVSTLEGETLGSTPLTLSGETLGRVSRGNRLLVLLDHPGYIPRQLILDLHGDDSVSVQMSRLDQNYFKQRLLKDFHKNVNTMVRTLLKIQGMIMVKDLTKAEQALFEFQREYPNIAASYALLANIELLKGNTTKAQAYLLRGETLDPDDPEIKRALGIQPAPKKPTGTSSGKKK